MGLLEAGRTGRIGHLAYTRIGQLALLRPPKVFRMGAAKPEIARVPRKVFRE